MLRAMLQMLVLWFGLQVVLACKQGDLIREPYNCAEYNECVGEFYVRKECTIGKYFDGSKCDYMWNVNCVVEKCDEGKNYTRGHCIQEYDTCFLGKTFRTSCPTGSRFNGENCVPTNICKGNSLEPKTVLQAAENIAARVYQKCTDGDVTNHPTDCTMYQLCVNGHWEDKSCPPFQHFDVAKLQCAYWTYTCGYGDSCSENDTRPIYGRCSEYQLCVKNNWTKKYCDNGTYYQDGSCQNKPCPLRPVANNCSCFMEPGSDKQYKCPSEQLFDKIERQCVAPQDARCFEGECEDGDVTYLSSDCTKYLKCQNGNWTEQSCPWLKHFDIKTKQCNFFGYTCGHDDPPQPTTTSPRVTVAPTGSTIVTSEQPKKCRDNDKRAVSEDCKSYQICTNGNWTDYHCYLWGRFDELTKQCFYFKMWAVHCAKF